MGSESALFQQLDKLHKHSNQGSLQTRYRYYEGAKRFAVFAATTYKLQKFANLKDKHLLAYVKSMQSKGLSASTIKTDLSAIRFFYDLTGNQRPLIDNKTLSASLEGGLERRSFGKVPRAWTSFEIDAAKVRAIALGETALASTISFAATFGLRIHETIRLDRDHLTRALRDDYLTIKGKGGLLREIPMTTKGRLLIQDTLVTASSGKLFVSDGQKAHQVIKHIENWIYTHRSHFTQGDRTLTYHGLRHTYAQERYAYHVERLHDEYAARLTVSRELGHGRDEVTRIYLAGMES